jgi:hypothetical protein
MVEDRKRGSLTDSVTLQELPFQYEPTVDIKNSTNYAEQKIMGRRLSNRQWVGSGKGDVSIDFTLVCVGYTNLNPSNNEVDATIRKQRQEVLKQEKPTIWKPPVVGENGKLLERGKYIPNPNYNPAKIYDETAHALVDNPNYVNPVEPASTVASKLKSTKEKANLKILDQIAAFQKFIEPQEDTGAPHPVIINMGKSYLGRLFLVESLDVSGVVTNYGTLDPIEAHIKLKLIEIPVMKKVV